MDPGFILATQVVEFAAFKCLCSLLWISEGLGFVVWFGLLELFRRGRYLFIYFSLPPQQNFRWLQVIKAEPKPPLRNRHKSSGANRTISRLLFLYIHQILLQSLSTTHSDVPARLAPPGSALLDCLREERDPRELFSSDSLGQCIRTDSSLSARW